MSKHIELSSSWILLRKIPFRETSLIVSGLSPDYGRIDFMIRGARNITKIKFPQAELFREFQIGFHESHGESSMASLISMDMTACHDAISMHTKAYYSACNFASFLLRNSKPMLEQPRTFAALKRLLSVLETKDEPEPESSMARLVFLHENGYVPDSDNPRLQEILSYAENANSPKPDYPGVYWKRFVTWVASLEKFYSLDQNP